MQCYCNILLGLASILTYILTLSVELDVLWDINLLDLQMSYVISFG